MRTPRRLAILAALAAAALTATGCDASPYAASVGGTTISQTALNNELKAWASNKKWVNSFDSANAQQQGGGGTTVAGTGGAGTYSLTFAADILATMVQNAILQRHLAATHRLPGADEVVASRAVNELLRSSYWAQFPESVRQLLVDQLADDAVLTPASDAATLAQPYREIQPYLFSRICVQAASAFTRASAEAIANSGVVKGSTTCDNQLTLEGESEAFQAAVLNLAPGSVSTPIQTSYGFEVVKLISRDGPGLSPGVVRVLSAATASDQPKALTDVLSAARVRINPEYGTWSSGRINPPQANTGQ